jgi:pyridoxal phosphate enzyme (YggS family)
MIYYKEKARNPMSVSTRIAENLAEVRARVAAAAARGGRRAEDVRIVAVTKYVRPPEVEALLAAGCRDLGESRPQELWSKAEAVSKMALTPTLSRGEREPAPTPTLSRAEREKVFWHLVGHLQRNKVRRTLPLVQWIHSADSLRLLEELDKQAGELGCRLNVLLEVNVSGEAAKHGFQPDELNALLPQLGRLRHVHVRGLMGMAALEGGLETARRNFAALRQLRDHLAPNAPPSVSLQELSMGMSRDYVVAVEEGATMVRIGSALFEGV